MHRSSNDSVRILAPLVNRKSSKSIVNKNVETISGFLKENVGVVQVIQRMQVKICQGLAAFWQFDKGLLHSTSLFLVGGTGSYVRTVNQCSVMNIPSVSSRVKPKGRPRMWIICSQCLRSTYLAKVKIP